MTRCASSFALVALVVAFGCDAAGVPALASQADAEAGFRALLGALDGADVDALTRAPAGLGFRAAGDLDATSFEDLSLPCSGGGAMILSGTLTLDLPAAGELDPGDIDPENVDADFDPIGEGDLDMSVSFEYSVDFDGCTEADVVIDGTMTWTLGTELDGDTLESTFEWGYLGKVDFSGAVEGACELDVSSSAIGDAADWDNVDPTAFDGVACGFDAATLGE